MKLLSSRYLLLFSFLAMLTSSCSSQSDIKRYSAGKLTWKDYRHVKERKDTRMDAESFLGVLIYITKTEKGKVYLDVYAYQKKSQSWVNKSTLSSGLLEHEQGHMDIEEIGARMLRSELSRLKITNEDSLFSLVFSLKTKIETEFIIPTQNSYDLSTSHGFDLNIQKLWNDKNQNRLDSLKSFSDEKCLIQW
jgi:hypothetical protein